jgi:hypothetical protein
MEKRTVLLTNLKVTRVKFSGVDAQMAATAEKIVRDSVPKTAWNVSLDRILAALPAPPPPANPPDFQNSPPRIFVSQTPARLLLFQGEPVMSPIQGTDLQFAANTNWPVFLQTGTSKYYLLDQKIWQTADQYAGPWSPTTSVPDGLNQLPATDNWKEVPAALPPIGAPGGAPTIFVSTTPAEIIVTQGAPQYRPVAGTRLKEVANTDSDLFWYTPTFTYYYLVAGRWFRAKTLDGPWTFTTYNLPQDFSQIPPDDPHARVLASVPGTPEAKDALITAQIPQTATINLNNPPNATVSYSGDPQFKPIEGTSMSYAVNTSSQVVQVGQTYYLCQNAIWFSGPTPQGPWVVCTSVPQDIYSIPPSSPVYNVTYVQVYNSDPSSGTVTDGYTAGFLGGMIVGGVLAWGTGYDYPPYAYGGIYYPTPYTYGTGAYFSPYTGQFYTGGAAYGPYGGIGATASYNPATGTYARGAAAYGPYGGSGAVHQAYNPYTGTYAQGGHYSTPYGSYGSGTVTRGDQWAQGSYRSNAYGTAGQVHTSAGTGVAGYSTARGSGGVAQTANGNTYVDHNGNVYKNSGGSWQSYNNGSWNNVSKPSTAAQQYRSPTSSNSGMSAYNQARAQQYRGSATPSSNSMQSLNREASARQYGSMNQQRFQNWQRSGSNPRSMGSFGGGGFGGGRYGGGGGFGGRAGGGGFGGGGFGGRGGGGRGRR